MTKTVRCGELGSGKTNMFSRRAWLKAVSFSGALMRSMSAVDARSHIVRNYNLCVAPNVVVSSPELLDTIARAGVGTIWLAGFFYGHRPYPDGLLRRAVSVAEARGMKSGLITVPLGHPGDSLGAKDGDFPLTPPGHWQPAVRPDGREYVGTSLHEPATAENCSALRHLRNTGFDKCFLDDDFRLARGPGEIGGCFCEKHRRRFLSAGGYTQHHWQELLDDVAARRLTRILKSWVDFTCDELTSCFRAQRKSFRRDLGIMVMYLGAEKAGIRLRDYRSTLFRVGELMFDDASFGPTKGKTDELFSALFHRRFAAPELAFSETTAFPSDRLSAPNMAAKLVVSTIADVRNTMFMSGLTPFPHAHWHELAPAMAKQTAIHRLVVGHHLRGPFKHFWGEAERTVGNDRPFSLWLATGVPFEVVDKPLPGGWTFLSDFDARELAYRPATAAISSVCRPSAASRPADAVVLEESLAALFEFKNRISLQLQDVPHVLENEPAVCAWYPSAHVVLVWNLAEQWRELTVIDGPDRHALKIGPLAAEIVRLRSFNDGKTRNNSQT